MDELDNQEVQVEKEEPVKTFTQQELDEHTSGLKLNRDQIKQEKLELQKELEALKRAEQERERSKMVEKDDFKGLLSQAEQERDTYKTQLEELKQSLVKKEVDTSAFSLAASISLDEHYNELLSEQFKKYIVHTENGIMYEVDSVSVSKEAVINMISNKYPAIVKGSGMSGGGAGGSTQRGGASQKAFNEMNGAELIALKNSDPAEYARLRDASKPKQ